MFARPFRQVKFSETIGRDAARELSNISLIEIAPLNLQKTKFPRERMLISKEYSNTAGPPEMLQGLLF